MSVNRLFMGVVLALIGSYIGIALGLSVGISTLANFIPEDYTYIDTTNGFYDDNEGYNCLQNCHQYLVGSSQQLQGSNSALQGGTGL